MVEPPQRPSAGAMGGTIGLPTPADEIPGDFFESSKIPGVSRFVLYKRPSKNKERLLFLFFAVYLYLTKLNL